MRLRRRIGGHIYMFYTYVLWSDKLQKRYVGSCEDIKARIRQPNKGESKFTKGGIPWKLVYSEEYATNTEARKRETFLKSGIGRKWLDEKIRLQ